MTAPAGRARPRRHDPERRERIIGAALDVIAEHGVAGTTHRKVAAAADVPLGSMTYHFAGIDEVVTAAFTLLADSTADGFEEALGAARDGAEAVDAVVGLITGEPLGSRRNAMLSYEMYALAARNPDLRRVTDAWMARSRHELERHFDSTTAALLDALIEGLSIHRTLSLNPLPEAEVRAAVLRMVTTR